MELREWLIILGLVLVTIIVVDGVRRLQRQRRVPRLDQVKGDDGSLATDPEEAARQAEINWELPNGGARVVRPATQAAVEPKPKLQRQEHPGPSKVFSRMEHTATAATPSAGERAHEREREDMDALSESTPPAAESHRSTAPAAEPLRAERDAPDNEPAMQPLRRSDDEPRAFVDDSEVAHHDDDAEAPMSRFSRAGMAAALRSGSQRVSQSVQRMSSALQRHDDEGVAHANEPSLGGAPDLSAGKSGSGSAERQAPSVAFEPPFEPVGETARAAATPDASHADERPLPATHDDVADYKVTAHPVVEKARRHHVSAQRARETLAHAEEVIVISVMARNEEGFSGPDLLNLMLACGLRYSEMGIFLRYETEDAESDLQFAMVDVVKPGTFDLEALDDFATPGVTFLMPLPGAQDSAAAFEAMVETAMVLVRNMGGELKDENRSVMTAQTVGFARQRVQEFERLNRLHRYQAN
ncbi:cell division protein ZipA [Modicisalibacter muralis]|uniref:Cell division protein ZipA n=1 Tax=Modicisalibacter muralis TaxID=119000 RepID=A0A1G9JMR2_9GAMM|nr:cell division protein ZipA C-terminal FtsZ-binding domain-containing protein [Halomonas muralis]SDL38809.1 cell division protein ZipA [Halomonas muralis]